MYISKTLEKAVIFANFCREHKVSPRKTAEAMQMCADVNRHKGWGKREETRKQATAMIEALGFTDVTFLNTIHNEWPTFKGADDGVYQFPRM